MQRYQQINIYCCVFVYVRTLVLKTVARTMQLVKAVLLAKAIVVSVMLDSRVRPAMKVKHFIRYVDSVNAIMT